MRKEDWINISDKLPDMGVWVLVYAFNSFYLASLCKYREGDLFWDADEEQLDYEDVTHWMPLVGPNNGTEDA